MNKSDFLEYLYNRLPNEYIREDYKMGKPLYKFLQALNEGGFGVAINDMNNLLDIVDPSKCPDEIFPHLYNSFGLGYDRAIDINYQRKLLSNVGELTSRKGTTSAIEYLIRVLTSMDCSTVYDDQTRLLTVSLKASTVKQVEDLDNSLKVVSNYIGTQLPFYVTALVIAEVFLQTISAEVFTAKALGVYRKYDLTFNN